MKLYKGNDYVIVDEGSEAETIWRGKGFLAKGEKPAKGAKDNDKGDDADKDADAADEKAEASAAKQDAVRNAVKKAK